MGSPSLRASTTKALGLLTLVAVSSAVSCLEIDRRRVTVDPTGGTGGTGGTKASGGTGGASAGMGGTTSGGTAGASASGGSGGSTGGGDMGGTSGTGGSNGGAGDDTCEGPKDELTIDGTHWIQRDCNDFGIQGSWYCLNDDISDTDCVTTPRYDAELDAYCMSGTTIVDPTFAAWGVGIAFELNFDETDGKNTYDCEAHDIIGFELTVQGISGTPIRVSFTDVVSGSDPSPFVEFEPFGNETRTLEALIEDAMVPVDWPDATAGKHADPQKIMDVQFQVVGASDEEPFELCITRARPILAAAD